MPIVPLSSIATVRMGVTLRGRDATRPDPKGSFSLIQISDLENDGTFRNSHSQFTRIEPKEPLNYKLILQPGDILFPNRGVRTTAVVYHCSGEKAIVGAQFFILPPESREVIRNTSRGRSVPGKPPAISPVTEKAPWFRHSSAAGKKAGEFYTPGQVSKLIAILLHPKKGDTICDPTCGSGSLLKRRNQDSRSGILQNIWCALACSTSAGNPNRLLGISRGSSGHGGELRRHASGGIKSICSVCVKCGQLFNPINPRFLRWGWARWGLNPRPKDYESPALTAELQALLMTK